MKPPATNQVMAHGYRNELIKCFPRPICKEGQLKSLSVEEFLEYGNKTKTKIRR